MASIKRKAVTDERPSKKAKGSGMQKAEKPAKNASKAPRATSSNESKTNETQKKSVTTSILQQEERAFPRGGGSVLTPLEHRQIKAQAERDVLLEQETGHATDQNEELFDNEVRGSSKKGRKKSGKTTQTVPKIESSGVKIFGLSYKNLVVGSLVLGRVTAISSRDVALALPNNLTGYIPITNISKRLNSRIEKLLASEEEPTEDDDEDNDVDLKQLFHTGQWLRAVVTATNVDSTEGNGKSRRHIELAVDPAQVNSGLTSEGAALNSVVQASVRSVEDHGIVMDVSFSDKDVGGFISKKELGATYDLEKVQEGQVMLCLVTGKGSNGKVIKLSPDAARFSISPSGNEKLPILSDVPTIDAFQPGAGVSALIVESGPGGIVGKLIGMQDVVADILHSGSKADDDMSKKYKIGSKAKARIIWSLPNDDGSRHVGISFLEHLLTMTPASSRLPLNATQKQRSQSTELDQELRSSSIIEDAKVARVFSDRGLHLSLPNTTNQAGSSSLAAYAHISQLSDDRIDSLASTSGHFKLDSTHRVRILSYNPVDNVYYVSLKPSTLAQPFLRLEDLEVGELVTGTVDKILLGGSSGIVGVLVKLSDGLTALVPDMHLSDTQLKHPERKFREGLSVKAKVLSVDIDKRQARLTLKKSLVDDTNTQTIWKDYDNLEPGMEAKGTIARLLPQGAAVQFYGTVRAWLPVAEMSERFVQSPEQFFRLGQTVNVRILSVNPAAGEMKVSCKEDDAFSLEKQAAWDDASGGDIVNGEVIEKTIESVAVDLSNGLRGIIRIGHLIDGSAAKADSALKRIRVGQKVDNLLVIEKLQRSRTLLLSDKSSLIKDARSGNLIKDFETATIGQKVHGFVKNVTDNGVYVQFANGVVGMLPKSQLLPELLNLPSFGFRTDQSVAAWVIFVDSNNERISLSMRDQSDTHVRSGNAGQANNVVQTDVEEPIDETIHSLADFSTNRVTKAQIVSVKATQVNVRLAKNVQGRIDVSEAFDTWEEITNKTTPLQTFKTSTLADVKILGVHDARSHRFLPISHRQGKVPVFELSAKKSRITDGHTSLLSFDSVSPGASYLAFVNNHSEGCVWVNLSPNVRGRIALMDLSHDLGLLQDAARHFPVGSALRVQVKSVDPASNRLDLTAKEGNQAPLLNYQDLSPGMVVAARIIQITDRQLIVQVSDTMIGSIGLVELSDDYEQANLAQHSKYDIVRACIIDVDLPNKKIHLSLRPSKVLSSSLPVKDSQITSTSQLSQGDIVRGFVKNISDKGVFISLGARVDAFVRISDLSDQYIKDWKKIYTVDQLVKGRVVAVDQAGKSVLLSLKSSQVDKDYTPPLTLNDLKVGQVVTGKVRKVEDFGAFIDIDNTLPKLSGLCHRSEVAAKKVDDVRKLYNAGDIVKARVLQVDVETRKISLGLKASYFEGEISELDEDEQDELASLSDSEEELAGGVEIDDVESMSIASEGSIEDSMDVDEEAPHTASSGLKTNGFDWTGEGMDADVNGAVSESEHETNVQKKRKRNKAEIKIDKTGELDEFGPQSVSDFERQLLGRPNDSGLWIQYMALQLQLSEIQKARDIAERALRTINIRETEEKANIWIAWMNLEVEYGDDERVEDVFKQACQVQDPLEMHGKLASIYIDSGKLEKADATFDRMIGNKNFRASPEVWYNYATYLMDTAQSPSRARALLPRALQSIANHEHRSLTAKFAALEFRSKHGDVERGRTIFEGLVTEWPKWSSGWDMWADLERNRISSADSKDTKDEAQEKVRALFGRMANQKMKKRRARFVFKKWLEFEELEGNEKQADRVKALAKAYVEKLQSAGGEDSDA